MRNEGVLLRVNEQRNILHEVWKWKANSIGHILRRNCLVKQIIEGKIKGQIEVTRRRGRRSKKLLDDLKDRRGYCQLKEEALDSTMWRNRFGRGIGPVVWQITDDDDDDNDIQLKPSAVRIHASRSDICLNRKLFSVKILSSDILKSHSPLSPHERVEVTQGFCMVTWRRNSCPYE